MTHTRTTAFIYRILLALLCLLSLSGTAQTVNIDKGKLDQLFDQLAAKNKAMGSILLVKNNELLYSRSIGFSSQVNAEKLPNSASTRYRIGSITKMFTATLILQLAEEKAIRLSDPLSKFFPQIPNASRISIEHILSHRSGIHDITTDADYRNWREQPISKEAMLAKLSAAPSDFEPGTKYAYSNMGYFLLGMIVEKICGTSYEAALKKRISSKLGLKDTYPAIGKIDPSQQESFSYRFTTEWIELPQTHASILFGAGFLISTPQDLIVFANGLFSHKLISANSLAQMTQLKMGIDTFQFNGKTFYGHTGGLDGFGAWLAYQPEEKLVVAYCTNGKRYPVGQIITAAFNIYHNQPFDIPNFDAIAIESEILDRYTGTYTTEGAPVKFTIVRNGNQLLMQMNDQPQLLLEAINDTTFKIENAGMEISFNSAEKQMIIKRNGRERMFNKQ